MRWKIRGILGDLNDQTTGHLVLQQLGLGGVAVDKTFPAVDRDKVIDHAVKTYDDLIAANLLVTAWRRQSVASRVSSPALPRGKSRKARRQAPSLPAAL